MARKDWKNLYKTARWKRLRQHQLQKQPFCQCPYHKGKLFPAEVVDHIEPHKGDLRLFYNPNNLQSLTKYCHDSAKQSQERGGIGFNAGCDETGKPLSAEHHWNVGTNPDGR